jgi:hypothetical protein
VRFDSLAILGLGWFTMHFFSRYLIRYFCQKFIEICCDSVKLITFILGCLASSPGAWANIFFSVRERLASNEWLPSHSILVYHSSMSIFAWEKPLNLLKSYVHKPSCLLHKKSKIVPKCPKRCSCGQIQLFEQCAIMCWEHIEKRFAFATSAHR